MGTRSGDLDPGVMLYLVSEGYNREQLDLAVNHQAGLLGVSGLTSDMRRLLDSWEKNDAARLALGMFCYQIRKTIGAMAAVLGGIDMLVFTGGIGEHAPLIRAQICSGLQFLGISIEQAANERSASQIGSGTCDVRVVEADEDLEIAIHSMRLAAASS